MAAAEDQPAYLDGLLQAPPVDSDSKVVRLGRRSIDLLLSVHAQLIPPHEMIRAFFNRCESPPPQSRLSSLKQCSGCRRPGFERHDEFHQRAQTAHSELNCTYCCPLTRGSFDSIQVNLQLEATVELIEEAVCASLSHRFSIISDLWLPCCQVSGAGDMSELSWNIHQFKEWFYKTFGFSAKVTSRALCLADCPSHIFSIALAHTGSAPFSDLMETVSSTNISQHQHATTHKHFCSFWAVSCPSTEL